MAFHSGPRVGLDIGTSAVRAARVSREGKEGSSLVRFGQVALPVGAVEGGEIRDPGAVSEAISQLWKREKFKTKQATVGVANQRVVVLQIDLPYMDEKELRSSIRYHVAEHIPMSVEESELDFQIIDDFVTEKQEHMMRVLLIAASGEMVGALVDAVIAAGLQPAGVDLTPFAVARAVSEAARGEIGNAGAEAIIDIGAGVTNIIVHHNSEPRFVRILLVGGDDVTTALMDGLDISFEEAEGLKLDLGKEVTSDDVGEIVLARVDSLVSEIQGSIDYYLSLQGNKPVTSVIIAGGGSLTPGLVDRLQASLGTEVRQGQPLAEMVVKKSGLTTEQVEEIEPLAATAVGLALGALSI